MSRLSSKRLIIDTGIIRKMGDCVKRKPNSARYSGQNWAVSGCQSNISEKYVAFGALHFWYKVPKRKQLFAIS